MGRASGPPPPGEIWIGDDAAIVTPPSGPLVLATDAVVGGVHCDLALTGLDDLGWKGLTAAVSDIGAVGARPLHALVTFCVPPGADVGRLADGVAQASAEWGCPVVGGDVTAAGDVVVSVAVTGVLDGPEPAVLRSGARPGDHLFVTGPLGASAAGLRVLRAPARRLPGDRGPADVSDQLAASHRRPTARLAEGVAARRAGATAMIDISDGLSIDLHRVADASGVGFRLDRLPVAAGAIRAEALGGGEDYELLIAVSDPETLERAFADAALRPPLAIGRVTGDPSERLLDGDPLPRTGWEHRIG
jgi:thiamine-monophosphate kinase